MWGSKDVEVEAELIPRQTEVRVEAQDTQTKQNIEKELMQELKTETVHAIHSTTRPDYLP